ncbi:MAG: hypothetical protein U0324_28895 [Polyangiales bacterium]
MGPIHSTTHRRARAAASVVALTGIGLFVLACATTRAPAPTQVVIAEPTMEPSLPPPVRRSTGPWVHRRLGYTALTYEMPEVPEALAVDDDDHCEVARVSRDDGRVRFEVRSFEHESATLNNVDQLIATALTATARRMGGVRRSLVNLTQGGYPGADLTFDFPQSRGTLRVRMLVGRSRYYAAIVAYPSFAETALRPDVERFHNSLAFDAGDQPEADGDGAIGAPQYVEPVGAWFAVRMPGRPRREARTLALPAGERPRIAYAVASAAGEEGFEVAVTAFPRRPPPEALAAVVAQATAQGATLRGERPVTAQGYAGRAYTIEHAGGQRVTELRVFVTETRLYEVRATRPAAPAAEVTARVDAFFNTLRIL